MSSSIDSYIEKARAAGMADNAIKKELVNAGWEKDIVESKFLHVPTPPSPSQNSVKPSGATSMWDVFENILLFISMYVFAFSISLLIHRLIDVYLPSSLSRSRDVSGFLYSSYTRGLVSSVIVSFPVFSILFIRVSKRVKRNYAVKQLVARKVLIYATLVVTFIIILYQFTKLVNSLLEGAVDVNFFFHVLVTVGVSGLIFGYYYFQVRDDHIAADS